MTSRGRRPSTTRSGDRTARPVRSTAADPSGARRQDVRRADGARRRVRRDRRRRVLHAPGAVGIGQDHAAADHRRAARRRPRRGRDRRPKHDRPPAAHPRSRRRVPVVGTFSSPQRRRQRRLSAPHASSRRKEKDDRVADALDWCSFPTCSIAPSASSAAARASASPWPGRWSTSPASCCSTNPFRRWTAAFANRCSWNSPASTASSA